MAQLLDAREFGLSFLFLAHGLIEAAQAVMTVRLGGIEFHGTLQGRQGFVVVRLLGKDGSQVHMSDAKVWLARYGLPEQRFGLFQIIALPLDVSEIGQSLGVLGIDGELALKFGLASSYWCDFQ